MRTGESKVNCGLKPRSSRFWPAEACSGDVWRVLIGHSPTVENDAKQYNCETVYRGGKLALVLDALGQPDSGNPRGKTRRSS